MELGFEPVHFGVFVVCALSVGFITPPVGINLFAAVAVSDEPFLNVAVWTRHHAAEFLPACGPNPPGRPVVIEVAHPPHHAVDMVSRF